MKIKRGSTSVRRLVFIADSSSTTGAGLANLVYNSSGLTAWYFAGDLNNEVQITLASATLGTWTSGGFVAVDNTNMPGWYEIGIPNAALDGGNEVAIQLRGATNMVPVNLYIELDAVDYQSATNFGLSDVTAIKAKTDQLAFTVANQVDSNSLTGGLTQAQVRSAVGLASANLDTQLAAIPTASGNASAVRTNLATELGRIDAAISTRLATSSYSAPLDAAGTRNAIGLASANLDTQLAAIPAAVEAELDITVLPLDATVVDRVAGTTINLFTNETPSVAVAVVDSAGAAVDLTNLTLEIVIELRPSADVAVIANANISKSNGSFSFTVPSAVTNAARACKWALRKTSDSSVLVQGDLFVNYAPKNDA